MNFLEVKSFYWGRTGILRRVCERKKKKENRKSRDQGEGERGEMKEGFHTL